MTGMTKILSALLGIAAVLLVVPSESRAQNVTLLCPDEALNIGLYTDTVSRAVRAAVDQSKYRNVRVRITWRSMGPIQEQLATTSSEIVSGLTIQQVGLVSALTGSLQFQPRCDYRYIAKVRVIATDRASGVRLSSSNESIVTITSAGAGDLVIKGR